MFKPRVKFMRWKKHKTRKQREVLTAWKLSFKARRLDRVMVKRRFLRRWFHRVNSIISEREMSKKMFNTVNAQGSQGGAAQIFKFMEDGTSSNRVRSEEEIRKEQRMQDNVKGAVKMTYFRRWKYFLRLKRQSRADAQLCLKRCMKLFSTLMRPMWVGERVRLFPASP